MFEKEDARRFLELHSNQLLPWGQQGNPLPLDLTLYLIGVERLFCRKGEGVEVVLDPEVERCQGVRSQRRGRLTSSKAGMQVD